MIGKGFRAIGTRPAKELKMWRKVVEGLEEMEKESQK